MISVPTPRVAAERGISLLELLIALVVLSIGVLSLSQLFPAGSRSQVQSRMRIEASQYSRERIESLEVLSWSDTALTSGRHPGGTATEPLGTVGSMKRYYQVDSLPAPLTNLKRVTVSVVWKHIKPCTLQAVTYLRK
ncbi:MAG TPA: prepilin-type N-terminal cleavage/methylation domain-containing protein [Candidatus Eisenbacteria bacterium]|jgi:prepilin-type N-terminal cleavage/methylation domain-containing protein